MDLDDIKRGLRAEIKKRENEQYFTFQCNVRQMCKDVLAKLEEQEVEIAEKDEELRHHKYKRCLAMVKYCDMGLTYYNEKLDSFSCERADFFYKWYNRWWKLAKKFKEAK